MNKERLSRLKVFLKEKQNTSKSWQNSYVYKL